MLAHAHDLAAGSVLHPRLARWAVLGCEGDDVAFAQPVVGVFEWDLAVAEFAALGAEVLGASVESVDLLVGGVSDQRDLAYAVLLGECHPALDGGLAGLVAGVREVKLCAFEVVRHRALRFAGPKGSPCPALVGVLGAPDVGELCVWGMGGEPVEHPARSDRGELLAVTDGDQLCSGALDQLGEGIHALVVDHPGLVEEDRRGLVDLDGPGLGAGDQRVECQRPVG
jgi:hypothetical protein